ncbi:MAG: hypothetical protein AAGN82_32160, partial [Myxococcota bacterium]
ALPGQDLGTVVSAPPKHYQNQGRTDLEATSLHLLLDLRMSCRRGSRRHGLDVKLRRAFFSGPGRGPMPRWTSRRCGVGKKKATTTAP